MNKKFFMISFMLILFLQITYSQNDTFRLGFTGMYPDNWGVSDPNHVTYSQNWEWFHELNLNYWQAWWVNDTAVTILQDLNSNNLYGYFQPDTIRQVGYGRQQINYAADGRDSRFKYNTHFCGQSINDNSQWGNGQLVMYYNVNYNCNQQGPSAVVLSNVNENGFQTFSGLPYNPRNRVSIPDSFKTVVNTYYIKPRMRISVDDAFSDPPKNVCKVIIRAFNSSDVGTP